MKLTYLCFEGDRERDLRIREETNFCDCAHLFAHTWGICQVIFSLLEPIDLDGSGKLTIKAALDEETPWPLGYTRSDYFKVSLFRLDRETALTLYQFQSFGLEFQRYAAGLVLDILVQIDQANGGPNRLVQRRDALLEELERCCYRREVLLEKHCKTSRDRRYRALVWHCFGQEAGESIRVDLVDSRTQAVLRSQYLNRRPGTIPLKRLVRKTAWEPGRFCVVWGDSLRTEPRYVELPQEKNGASHL